MNRLILVGNGFDLAHGLKTRYRDFIDDFWQNTSKVINSEDNLVNLEKNEIKIDNALFLRRQNEIKNFTAIANAIDTFNAINKFNEIKINFENKFLENISKKNALQNWVDIENEYYSDLKKVKNPSALSLGNKSEKINKLNQDFEEIKKLLIRYLDKIDKKIILKENISKNILSTIKIKDLLSKYQKEIIQSVIKNSILAFNDIKLSEKTRNFVVKLNKIDNLLKKIKFVEHNFDKLGNFKNEILDFFPYESLILNFNYTESANSYIDEFNKLNGNYVDYNISEIHIHGELNNQDNPIIFGFGDDVDKKYQEFEDLNDNRYLENFKSIAYLQTDNYKKLLELVDSEEYQVFIFGHSCGISDRTMLNTIFEHENCKSVKAFYHLKKDGSDNYTEIVQNISRNFNDRKKFRDRVVNKTYCEPLT